IKYIWIYVRKLAWVGYQDKAVYLTRDKNTVLGKPYVHLKLSVCLKVVLHFQKPQEYNCNYRLCALFYFEISYANSKRLVTINTIIFFFKKWLPNMDKQPIP